MADGDEILDPKTGLLRQQESWNNTPGSALIADYIPPNPGQTGALGVDISKEYVAAGYYNWYTNWIRVLPFPIDDVTTDFGIDLYDRMLNDPAVLTGVNVYRASVLEDGVQFSPAIQDKADKDYEDSLKIYKNTERMWQTMTTPGDEMLWNLEEACAVGNKVGEKIWTLDRSLDGTLKWRVRRINIKPTITVAFAVNVHKDIIGLLGLIPGIGFPVQIGTILTDPGRQPNLLPRDKFVVRTFRMRDNDPRGTSIIRAAYTAWNLKMQLYGEYLKWLTQFATPSIIGFSSPQALPRPKMDSDGNPVLDASGNQVLISAPELMADKLADLKNSTAVAFPGGSDVKVIEMRGQGRPFLDAFKFLNDEITQAIQHQALTTQSPQSGTRSQASVHQNTQETMVRQGKKPTVATIRADVVVPFVHYNYGRNADYLTPRVGLGQIEAHDFAANAAGVAALQAAHYFDESQIPGLDEMQGLPPRGDNWQKRWKEAQQLAAGGGPKAQVRTPRGPSNAAGAAAA